MEKLITMVYLNYHSNEMNAATPLLYFICSCTFVWLSMIEFYYLLYNVAESVLCGVILKKLASFGGKT